MVGVKYMSPYLAVQASWLPTLVAFSLFSSTTGMVFWFHGKLSLIYVLLSLLSVAVISFI